MPDNMAAPLIVLSQHATGEAAPKAHIFSYGNRNNTAFRLTLPASV